MERGQRVLGNEHLSTLLYKNGLGLQYQSLYKRDFLNFIVIVFIKVLEMPCIFAYKGFFAK